MGAVVADQRPAGPISGSSGGTGPAPGGNHMGVIGGTGGNSANSGGGGGGGAVGGGGGAGGGFAGGGGGGGAGSSDASALDSATVTTASTKTPSVQFIYTLPTTAPSAPTIGAATRGNGQATVAFTAPSSNGGASITNYTVTSSPEGITEIGAHSPIVVTGLTNGVDYTFTVTATNSVGTSVASGQSNQVTPATVPSTPATPAAGAGNGQASVSFVAPATNGSAITGYTVTSHPGNITATGTSSPIIVNGLTNGLGYNFTVTATNGAGTSLASQASNSVTPVNVPQAPTGVSATVGDKQSTVSFTAPSDTGGTPITGYTVTSSPGGLTATGTTSPIVITGLTNGTQYTFRVKATNGTGDSIQSNPSSAVTPVTPVAVSPGSSAGYVVTGGSIAPVAGYANSPHPVTGVAPTAGGTGAWTVANDGGVFATGTAAFYGSMGGQKLNQPITGISDTKSGAGYYLVASDGGVFAFGDAKFRGSMGAQPLNQPVNGIGETCSGLGYYLVASDGGVFAYGDAQFYGSMGGKHLNSPIVSITPTCGGYYLLAADGGVFAYGSAAFYGSGVGQSHGTPNGLVPTPGGTGYWLGYKDGTILKLGS